MSVRLTADGEPVPAKENGAPAAEQANGNGHARISEPKAVAAGGRGGAVVELSGARPMIDSSQADHFAAEWVAAWNARDLDRILTHYASDFEMTSPNIVSRKEDASGTLRGKEAVGRYWQRALDAQPELHFELEAAFPGVRSITLVYRTGFRRAAEVLEFDEQGLVIRGNVHYLSGHVGGDAIAPTV